MPPKLYLWRIRMRGQRLYCHATDTTAALADFAKQTGEPVEEYCLEWEEPKNLDGTPVTAAERDALWESHCLSCEHMSNPIPRYEPSSKTVYTGIFEYEELFMREDPDGSYINRFTLTDKLEELLAKACDPGESDAYRIVLDLVKGKLQ